MDAADLLLTIAEIGAALTGFTGIIGALQGAPAADHPATRLSFWLMIEFSLATIFFGLAPFALTNFEIAEPVVWTSSSAAMGLFIIAHLVVAGRRVRVLSQRGQWPLLWTRVVFTLFAAVSLVQWLNVAGIVFERTFAAYWLGLMLFLMLASINFVGLMAAILGDRSAMAEDD